MRCASPKDADSLSAFNARIHSDDGPDKPDERLAAWTRDLLTIPHPTFESSDFTLVEDTNTGKIVSSMNLIPQTWSYAGIPFPVGRPELVGTLPEYRNRGLIRAQFETIHQWSAERGHKLQAITGIPYYYRLFGYEMAINLGGGRTGYKSTLPKLKDEEPEPYQVRPAGKADIPFIDQLYQRACQRYLVNCVWDEALWHYELIGKSPKNVNRLELRIITARNNEPVGYLAHHAGTWGPIMTAAAYELKEGVSWGEVTPSVIRYLYETGKTYAARDDKLDDFDGYGFWLGDEHPAYKVMQDTLPRQRKPYAWYIRVPDLPGFLVHITPALEERLSRSPYAGHTGELKLTFYRAGLHLVLENGRLTRIDPWKPEPQGHSGDAAFPGLTFLQLLFGYRSFEELDYAFPDCWRNHDTAFGLLNALFPKQSSDIWPIA
jgi:hypothetical protein